MRSGSNNYTEFAYQFLSLIIVSPLSSHNISPLANCIYPCRKKDTRKPGRCPVENATHAAVQMYTVLEYGQFFLYLNNGEILDTDLSAN